MENDQEKKKTEFLRADDVTQAKSPIGLIESEIAARSATDLAKGQIILDRYKVISLIGRGAMGAVYRVEQLAIRKQVALKTLNPISASDVNVRRFQNEALAASKLEHPNLVRALDYGWLGNQPFMVMDLVEGPTLAQHLRQNTTLTLPSIYQIFIPICFALAYAHQEGVIHRDLKPSNIVLARSGDGKGQFIPKLVDFGIAKLSTEQEALTKTGEIFGTPLYMSPEQCLGSKVDIRSDIYSLGCVLYEALTGGPPFSGQSALETMMQHKEKTPLPLKQAALGVDFPPALQRIVSKMLEKEPSLRYQNFLDVAQDLTLLQQGRSELIENGNAAARKGKKLLSIPALVAVVLGISCVAGTFAWLKFSSHRHTKAHDSSPSTSMRTTNSASPTTDPHTKAHTEIEPVPQAGPSAKVINGERVFNFGTKAVGRLSIMDNIFGYPKDEQDAVGLVKFPKDAPLMLQVSLHEAYNNPNLFKQFKADDLRALTLIFKGYEEMAYTSDGDDSFDNPLTYASHLTLLRYLNFKDAPISMVGLRNLNIEQMHDLKSLVICATNVDGNALAQYPKLLQQLESLDVSKVRNVPKILLALRKSTPLGYLLVADDNLKDSDLSYIADMPNLFHITLSGNPITDAGLSKLSHLHFLFAIKLARCEQITPAAAKELAKFPALRAVAFPAKLKYFENKIRKDLPKIQLDFYD